MVTRYMSRTDAYLSGAQRHSMCCKLADYAVKVNEERGTIIELCPPDYSAVVTDDHRNLVWDRCYEEAAMLDDYSLSRKYEELLHPNGAVADRLHDSSTWIKDRKLCN